MAAALLDPVAEYRVWWETNTDVPYGFCWCGCGEKTKVAKQSREDFGWIKGEPRRFLRGHHFRVGPDAQVPEPNPSGYCWCGCGGRTALAEHTDPGIGWVKGEPKRYLPGHLNTSRAAWATDAQKNEICRRYAEGEGSYALAEEFGVHGFTVSRMLNQRGVKRRSASEVVRTRSCDHSFFDIIDTEAKAYWLGMMAADGNVVTGRPILKLAFASQDRDHLLRFRTALQSTHAITDYTTTSGHGGSKFSIASPQLVEGLARHGVGPCKSFTLEWPGDLLSAELLRHYLRGYFDGDGNFSVRLTLNKAPVLLWTIVGNEAFCLGAQQYLIGAVGVNKTKLHVPKNSPNVRKLSYCGARQTSRIFHLMYDDTTIWLPRKRDKAAPYVRPLFESSSVMPDGEKLRALREERGIEVATLASAAGASPRTVYELESGKRSRTRFDTVAKIAKALKVETSELVGEE